MIMKRSKTIFAAVIAMAVLLGGCASMNKTQKGAAVGTATGAAAGAIVGKAAGNTALGAIIGALRVLLLVGKWTSRPRN